MCWVNYDHVQRIVLEIGSVLVQKPCPADLQIRNAHELFEERLAYFQEAVAGKNYIYNTLIFPVFRSLVLNSQLIALKR